MESTTKHSLECHTLVGKNYLVTYSQQCNNLYGNDETEQAFIARIVRDNMKRLPKST